MRSRDADAIVLPVANSQGFAQIRVYAPGGPARTGQPPQPILCGDGGLHDGRPLECNHVPSEPIGDAGDGGSGTLDRDL